MCGIVGFIDLKKNKANANILQKMIESLGHRGPDGKGQYIFRNLALGHTRLSIIDLSNKGSQPMQSKNGEWVISYNGEIYNFLLLREILKKRGYKFFSQSDTEVVLNSFIEWGPECLLKFNGMFSFSIFKKKKKELILARDRFGIKPIYYYKKKDFFLFSSEIKSFLFYPENKLQICSDSLAEYLTFQNFIDCDTLFKNVKILKPGSFLKLSLDGDIQKRDYFEFNFEENSELSDFNKTKIKLKNALNNAVNNQIISDVPVSSYLSGGIDSGVITALASNKIKKMKTFTIGFNMDSVSGVELFFDERKKAEKVSAELGTEHYELVLKSGDMERAFKKIVWHLEEPRVGQSYPNYYASKLASNFGKVLLTGIGGDELFAGYPWRYYKNKVLNNTDHFYNQYFSFWNRLFDHKELNKLLGKKYEKFMFFEKFKSIINIKKNNPTHTDLINYSLKFEIKTFLHGLLIVEDKLSMAHSLETRVPFLDNELCELASQIPLKMKLKNINKNFSFDENTNENKVDYFYNNYNDGKLILREAIHDILPFDISNERKQGFSGPDKSWFKGQSIDFVKDNLLDKNQDIFKYLDFKIVKKKVDEHLKGRRNNRLHIWSMLYLNYFIKTFITREI